METWRLLDTPPMTAAENMALDETLLELKNHGHTPNTIRREGLKTSTSQGIFYRFPPVPFLTWKRHCGVNLWIESYCTALFAHFLTRKKL